MQFRLSSFNRPIVLKQHHRRSFSTVTADELLRKPIFERVGADPDTLQDLDAFPVPVLSRQLSEALRLEFSRPILVKTEWEHCPPKEALLEQIRGDWWRASRLIHETLAIWRNRPGNPIAPSYTTSATALRPSRGIENPQEYSQSAVDWIQKECDRLYAEVQSGCVLRFESFTHLIPENVTLTAEQEKIIEPALIALGKSRELHPEIKKEICGHICSVIIAATGGKK